MPKNLIPNLESAMNERRLVRYRRCVENGRVDGFILGMGPEFVLISAIGEGIRHSGFECHRIADIRKLRVPHPFVAFYERAMELRNEPVRHMPEISLTSISELLLSASKAFPLMTIHREEVDSNVCHIGRINRIAKKSIWLHEINPDATWDDEPSKYRLREITRVDFGGEYEEALHLVGGDPPALISSE